MDKDLIYRSTSLDMELLTGAITFHREPDDIDQAMLDYWFGVFEEVHKVILS